MHARMVLLIMSDMAETGSDHRLGSDLESCEAAPALGDRGRLHAEPPGHTLSGSAAENARNLEFRKSRTLVNLYGRGSNYGYIRNSLGTAVAVSRYRYRYVLVGTGTGPAYSAILVPVLVY